MTSTWKKLCFDGSKYKEFLTSLALHMRSLFVLLDGKCFADFNITARLYLVTCRNLFSIRIQTDNFLQVFSLNHSSPILLLSLLQLTMNAKEPFSIVTRPQKGFNYKVEIFPSRSTLIVFTHFIRT